MCNRRRANSQRSTEAGARSRRRDDEKDMKLFWGDETETPQCGLDWIAPPQFDASVRASSMQTEDGRGRGEGIFPLFWCVKFIPGEKNTYFGRAECCSGFLQGRANAESVVEHVALLQLCPDLCFASTAAGTLTKQKKSNAQTGGRVM